MTSFRIKHPRLVRRSIYSRKSDQRIFASKSADIANFRHQHWTGNLAGALHPHNNFVFRKKGSKASHLSAQNL